jgi:hypothetical protein
MHAVDIDLVAVETEVTDELLGHRRKGLVISNRSISSSESKGALERYNVRLGRSSPLAWAHAIALS